MRGAALRCGLLGQEIRRSVAQGHITPSYCHDRDIRVEREERRPDTCERHRWILMRVTVLHTIEISIYLIIHFEDPPYINF